MRFGWSFKQQPQIGGLETQTFENRFHMQVFENDTVIIAVTFLFYKVRSPSTGLAAEYSVFKRFHGSVLTMLSSV